MAGVNSFAVGRLGLGRSRSLMVRSLSVEAKKIEKVVGSLDDVKGGDLDPFQVFSAELKDISLAMQETVRISGVPTLDRAARYFLERSGKLFRPATMLLLASAAGGGIVLPSQRRLAEITEMIHTASLLHDDVIDVSDTRRGAKTVNSMLGNHVAVLAGDFVLARASAALARLNNCDVVSVLAQVIENLVRGEVIQINVSSTKASGWEDYFKVYLEKTYHKTASLIANSCRAVLMLGGQRHEICDAGFEFGKHLGLCFQLIDDALDITAVEADLGKPTCADLKSGNSTGPVLFAMREFPELQAYVKRRFQRHGDVEYALEKIKQSNGVEQTVKMAEEHAFRARESLSRFEESSSRIALENLTKILLHRRR